MIYPEELLPKEGNIELDPYKLEDCFLIRFFKDSKNECNNCNDLKNKTFKGIDTKYYPDFSTNLYGIYGCKAAKFKVVSDKQNEYWDFKSELPTKDSIDFVIVDTRKCVYIPINKLIGNSIIVNNYIKINPIIKHTPTYANYWHFSIMWDIISEGQTYRAYEVNLGKQIKGLSIKKILKDVIRTELIRKSICDTPPFPGALKTFLL